MALLLAFWRRFPDCASAWYATGVIHGIDMGRRQREAEIAAEDEAAWAELVRIIRAMGGPFSLSHAELEARRRALPDGYVPRPVPSVAECLASWDTERCAS